MFNIVAKICILCLICEVMEPASTLPLKHPTSDIYYEVRVKRSPSNLSLFGYHLPFTVPTGKITDTLSNFKNIFVTERKHLGTPSENAFNGIVQNSKKNGTHIMSLVDGVGPNKMLEEIKPIRVVNHNYSEYHIDKKLIDDIFKDLLNDNIQSDSTNDVLQENSEKNIEAQLKRVLKVTRVKSIDRTTTDINIDVDTDITDANEYETTTTDDFLRIDPSVVASLLG